MAMIHALGIGGGGSSGGATGGGSGTTGMMMSTSIHPFLALIVLLSQSHLRSALFHSETRPKFSYQGVSPRLP